MRSARELIQDWNEEGIYNGNWIAVVGFPQTTDLVGRSDPNAHERNTAPQVISKLDVNSSGSFKSRACNHKISYTHGRGSTGRGTNSFTK